jgi:hypothetical protein
VAYTSGDDRLGLVFVNLRGEREQSIRLTIDPAAFGLGAGTFQLLHSQIDSRSDLGSFDGRRELELSLPPREVVLIEAVRSGEGD